MTHIAWPGQDNFRAHISTDEGGNVHMRAVDFDSTQAEIVMSANGFQFTVSFLYRMPNKKAQWLEMQDNQSLRNSCTSSMFGKS